MLVGFNDGTKTYLYTRNLQGDIIAITDTATETVVATYTYDSWGNVLTATGTMAEVNPFRYRGYYYDAETSLYYLQSRYYDAEVGRFINADAYVSTGQGMIGNNMYAYCGNGPVNRIDITGAFFKEIGDWFSDAWNWTKQAATDAWNWAKQAAIDASNWISNNWKKCMDWATGVSGIVIGVVGILVTVGVVSIPVVGQVVLGVVGVGCGIWGLGRLAELW